MVGSIAESPPNHVRRLRQQCGFSQGRLAEMVQTSRNTIGSIERGEWVPHLDLAKRIARALNSDLNTVFGEGAIEPEPAPGAAE